MITLFDILLITLASTSIGIAICIAWNYIMLKNTQENWEYIPEKIIKSEAFEEVYKRMTLSLEQELLKTRKDFEEKFKAMAHSQQLLKIKLQDIEKKLEDIATFEVKSESISLNLDSIKENTLFLDYIKNSLEIDLIKSTLLLLQPEALNMKNLDQWQQHTLYHFWQLYQLKPEFLPSFKAEILREIKALPKEDRQSIPNP